MYRRKYKKDLDGLRNHLWIYTTRISNAKKHEMKKIGISNRRLFSWQ